MGVDYTTAKFCLERRVNWEQTLTIGRQNWWLSRRESKAVGCPIESYSRTNYSEAFFRKIGAKLLDSVDISPNECPSFTADLSQPGTLKGRVYNAICDFGTAEHIADQLVYWENLWNSLMPFGSLLVVVPANQMCGHGLYQYSPEFFTRMGGFGVRHVEVVEYGWSIRRRVFSEPGRFEISTRYPAYIFAHLIKGRSLEFSMPVQVCHAQTTHLKKRNERLTGFLLDIPLVRRLQRIL